MLNYTKESTKMHCNDQIRVLVRFVTARPRIIRNMSVLFGNYKKKPKQKKHKPGFKIRLHLMKILRNPTLNLHLPLYCAYCWSWIRYVCFFAVMMVIVGVIYVFWWKRPRENQKTDLDEPQMKINSDYMLFKITQCLFGGGGGGQGGGHLLFQSTPGAILGCFLSAGRIMSTVSDAERGRRKSQANAGFCVGVFHIYLQKWLLSEGRQ